MESDLREEYAAIAEQCMTELLAAIESSPKLKHRPDEIVELLSLQLFGPMHWTQSDARRMQHLLQLDVEVTTPIIEQVVNKLRSEAQRLAQAHAADGHRHYHELVASFQIQVTWYIIERIQHKLKLTAGIVAGLTLIGTIGGVYTLYRIWDILRGQPPSA